MNAKTIAAPIKNVYIHFNSIVGDERGVFCNIAPGGTDNPIFSDGIKNISAPIATQKLVARGGHYHFRLKEHFYTLSGIALFYLYDFRPDSPTYQTGYALILGFEKPKQDLGFPVYAIADGAMPQLEIPAGVYHIFWPLSEEKVVTVHTGSRDYDPADYARPTIEEVPGAKEVFKKVLQKMRAVEETENQKFLPEAKKMAPIKDVLMETSLNNQRNSHSTGTAMLLAKSRTFPQNIDLVDTEGIDSISLHTQGNNTGYMGKMRDNTTDGVKAVITAARNTQLRPLTHTTNKHLIPLANKPMIFYAIEHLAKSGFKEIAIVVSPSDEEIRSFVGNGEKWNITIEYIEQTGGLRGLGHVLKTIKEHRQGNWLKNSSLLLYLGDNIVEVDLPSLIEKFKNERLNCLLSLAKIKNPQRFGVPEFQNGRLIKIEERPLMPKSDYAVAGIYLYDQNVFQAIENLKPSARGDYEIQDIHTHLIENNYKIGWQELESWWKDRGNPEDILEGNSFILEKIERSIEGAIDASATIQGRVAIGGGSKILGRTTIRGPVSIGQRAIIKDSFIGPYTSIGHNAEIQNAEIEYSLIMDDTHIATPSKITNSLIGKNSCVIAANSSLPAGYKIIAGENSTISI